MINLLSQPIAWLTTFVAVLIFSTASPAQAPSPANPPKESVTIPMRDGVHLAADIYRPSGNSGRRPTILMRTPYGKGADSTVLFARLFTSNGYNLLVEDKRGRFESEGSYTVADHEIADSYDTIEWITKQPWSDAKVGAYGCSDLGDAAIYAAVSRHPALKAVIPEAAGSTQGPAGNMYRYFGLRNGGAVELVMGIGWMVDNGTKHFLRPPPGLTKEQYALMQRHYRLNLLPPKVDFDQALKQLPVSDIMKNIGLPFTDFENLGGRSLDDKFFAKLDFLKGNEKISVPALHVNSWYDFAPGVTMWQRKFFEQQATNTTARENQYVLMSPGLHCNSLRLTDNYVVGKRPLGDPRRDIAGLYVRWFDHWLKGVENGVNKMPKVQYYMMGENKWQSSDRWPPTPMKPLRLHLGGTNANGPIASGTLTSAAQLAGTPPHQFVYDPANATPSMGGSLCCIKADALEGSYDQRGVESRADVLTYSTAPLTNGMWVAGPVKVVLHVSSSAPDTDFTAKLVDVYPDGTAYNLLEGILRARYRQSLTRPTLMQSGKVYELTIDLQDIANYFGPGHRLRIEIASSNFPRFDRNLNTGGPNFTERSWKKAVNSVHVDADNPSYVELFYSDFSPTKKR